MALFFQNAMGTPVWVAFAYYDPLCGPANQNFRKQGWWRLEPYHTFTGSPLFNAWDVDLRTINRFAYFYAETDGNRSNWSGSGNGWLSVNPAATFDQCAFEDTGNSQWVNFNEIDFTWIKDFTRADPFWDMVVLLWHWEGRNRIGYTQQMRKPNGEIVQSGIGPG